MAEITLVPVGGGFDVLKGDEKVNDLPLQKGDAVALRHELRTGKKPQRGVNTAPKTKKATKANPVGSEKAFAAPKKKKTTKKK